MNSAEVAERLPAWMCPNLEQVAVVESATLSMSQLAWLLTAIVVVVILFIWYSISYRLHRMEARLGKHIALDDVILKWIEKQGKEEA